MDHEALEPHRRLDSYGMDSLMAAQVLVSLNQRYDLDIPPMELLRSNGTIAEFARIVQLRLGLQVTAPPGASPGPGIPGPATASPSAAVESPATVPEPPAPAGPLPVPAQAGPDRSVTAGGAR